VQWNPDFFKSFKEMKIGLKNQVVGEIECNITVFDLREKTLV